jgi:hypothetical protein
MLCHSDWCDLLQVRAYGLPVQQVISLIVIGAKESSPVGVIWCC